MSHSSSPFHKKAADGAELPFHLAQDPPRRVTAPATAPSGFANNPTSFGPPTTTGSAFAVGMAAHSDVSGNIVLPTPVMTHASSTSGAGHSPDPSYLTGTLGRDGLDLSRYAKEALMPTPRNTVADSVNLTPADLGARAVVRAKKFFEKRVKDEDAALAIIKGNDACHPATEGAVLHKSCVTRMGTIEQSVSRVDRGVACTEDFDILQSEAEWEVADKQLQMAAVYQDEATLDEVIDSLLVTLGSQNAITKQYLGTCLPNSLYSFREANKHTYLEYEKTKQELSAYKAIAPHLTADSVRRLKNATSRGATGTAPPVGGSSTVGPSSNSGIADDNGNIDDDAAVDGLIAEVNRLQVSVQLREAAILRYKTHAENMHDTFCDHQEAYLRELIKKDEENAQMDEEIAQKDKENAKKDEENAKLRQEFVELKGRCEAAEQAIEKGGAFKAGSTWDDRGDEMKTTTGVEPETEPECQWGADCTGPACRFFHPMSG